jgi:hypothetical protein
MDAGLTERVMTRLEPVPGRGPWRPAWTGMALAAGLGLLAFFMALRGGRPDADRAIAFTIDAPDASRVSLVGDFNNWDPAATPLARVSKQGRWEAVVPLTPGRYQFTYMVDGMRWIRDPRLPLATGDDFGQPTSVITITTREKS